MSRILAIWLVLALAGCASGPHIETRYSSVSQDSRVQFIILISPAAVSNHPCKCLLGAPLAVITLSMTIHRRSTALWTIPDAHFTRRELLEREQSAQCELNRDRAGQPRAQGHRGRTGVFGYPERQIDALIELLTKLVVENGIKPGNILGHSEVAPKRKIDPGPTFPWKRLADSG